MCCRDVHRRARRCFAVGVDFAVVFAVGVALPQGGRARALSRAALG